MNTLTAMLLVGGESRRMQRDKATLHVVGEVLWQRQIRMLRQLEPRTLWVSARQRPDWCPEDIPAILDEPPSRGPLSGLAPALEQLETSHLLALAIDLPFMQAEHLAELWSMAEPGCGVVPLNRGGFEPLCAVYPREAAVPAQAQLRAGQWSLQLLLSRLETARLVKACQVKDSELSLYYNMNTPAQVPG